MPTSPDVKTPPSPRLRCGLRLLALVFVLTGCTSAYKPVNIPIKVVDEDHGYRTGFDGLHRYAGNNHIFLAFSGGGTRAAALSYGVMQELRDTNIQDRDQTVNLLQSVDSISSVSGGSFTAAYYGLYGDKLFSDFESAFLRHNVQSSLLKQLMYPSYWFRSIFTGFDRTEMAVDYYDRTLFHGATFADIPLDQRPFIRINATDLATGMRFDFSQSRFDLICSDLNQYPISRAIMASSAVPVAFPSIVLENHAGQCNVDQTRVWSVLDESKSKKITKMQLIEGLRSYRDHDKRRYIHLVDGGISDNLGLRFVIEVIDHYGDQIYTNIEQSPPDNILIILVNAETKPDRIIEQSANQPSVSTVVGAVSNAQIARYNTETQVNLQDKLDALQDHVKQLKLPTNVYFAQVSFATLSDGESRQFFNNLPTRLELDDIEVDTLIASARMLLRNEPEFKRFMKDNQGELGAQAVSDASLCEHLTHPACDQ